jgi:multidrug transporter EmrE-like cation transporter
MVLALLAIAFSVICDVVGSVVFEISIKESVDIPLLIIALVLFILGLVGFGYAVREFGLGISYGLLCGLGTLGSAYLSVSEKGVSPSFIIGSLLIGVGCLFLFR